MANCVKVAFFLVIFGDTQSHGEQCVGYLEIKKIDTAEDHNS